LKAPDERQIRSMFDGLVERYDLLNDVLSLGLDRWWRRRTAAALQIRPRDRVLDLGCGTGRLSVLLADQHAVTGVDVSGSMLREARRRYAGRVILVQGSAFRLPFADASFGGAVSAFVLRNLDNLPVAFGELARVLSPRGMIALVDITEPSRPLMRRLFDAYFGAAAPALGALVRRSDEYRYLVRSLAQLPPPEELCEMLRSAGFVGCAARPLTGGMVTLFTATRGVIAERNADG
jgi:demethylmenaquinone methyltransferase/2-methoxy-6-polyprenyl-1,4-benzoquinol methylase